MSIFHRPGRILGEYRTYVESVLLIADEHIRETVADALLRQHALWPDALVQVNPAHDMSVSGRKSSTRNSNAVTRSRNDTSRRQNNAGGGKLRNSERR